MIRSAHNPQIKHIRQLRHRKERERRGLFFVEGIRLVAEAIQSGAAIETLLIAPGLLTSPFAHGLVDSFRANGGTCLEVSESVFESLSQKDSPQGLGAVVRQHWGSLATWSPVHITPGLGGCAVALESVQDPGNLGTILRTCDAVGSRAVILLGHTTDPYDPSAVRASMGAIFTQQLIRTTSDEFAEWRAAHGIALVGACGDAPTDYRDALYPFPCVVLMGSERLGLSPAHRHQCDMLVRIPMVGRSDSLNLAVATALILYELFYQDLAQRRG